MKIDNKSFWEDASVIKTQDQEITKSADFEKYLFKKIITPNVNQIKIFGCGTGREVNEIAKFFPNTHLVASDIAENMIEKCNENIKLWGLNNVETLTCNALDFKVDDNTFDAVTFMNSILTYVPIKKEREIIFGNSYKMLKDNGVIIGVVHHQIGSKSKTIYFGIKRLLSLFIGKEKIGQRYTGFKGFKFMAYYYSKNELIAHLKEAGFHNIEVISLKEFYNNFGNSNYRSNGYNNLIFSATK